MIDVQFSADRPRPATQAHELHHAAPRCLLRLHDAAASELPLDTVGAWVEWTDEATRWSVPVTIAREDLAALVERSVVVMDREKHRLIHGGDFARWGARGGRENPAQVRPPALLAPGPPPSR